MSGEAIFIRFLAGGLQDSTLHADNNSNKGSEEVDGDGEHAERALGEGRGSAVPLKYMNGA